MTDQNVHPAPNWEQTDPIGLILSREKTISLSEIEMAGVHKSVKFHFLNCAPAMIFIRAKNPCAEPPAYEAVVPARLFMINLTSWRGSFTSFHSLFMIMVARSVAVYASHLGVPAALGFPVCAKAAHAPLTLSANG